MQSIILNAEGIGHPLLWQGGSEAATGVRPCNDPGLHAAWRKPTCRDRVYATMMGAMAVDLLCEGKSNRVVGFSHGEFKDFDIMKRLA